MSSRTKPKNSGGLVQMDRTARLYQELKKKKTTKPRELWKRDWTK
jgi:hypothetical protein